MVTLNSYRYSPSRLPAECATAKGAYTRKEIRMCHRHSTHLILAPDDSKTSVFIASFLLRYSITASCAAESVASESKPLVGYRRNRTYLY